MLKKLDNQIVTAIINPTYQCNDICKFCFAEDRLHITPDLTLSELKENLAYVRKKYGVNHIIISGGEPTMYPYFWEMMDFLYNQSTLSVSLNTNSLRLASPAFAKQLQTFFQKAKNTKKNIALSCNTIDHYPPHTPLEKTKLKGFLNAVRLSWKSNMRPHVIITVTKTNCHALPQLMQTIVDETKKHGGSTPQKIRLTLRGLYVGRFMNAQQKAATIPLEFIKLIQSIAQAIRVACHKGQIHALNLFNLPLCYFRHLPELPQLINIFREPAHEIRMLIDSQTKTSKIKAKPFHEENWDPPSCQKCRVKDSCGKIQNEYIEKYQYPELIPFTRRLTPATLENIRVRVREGDRDMSWDSYQALLNAALHSNIYEIYFEGSDTMIWEHFDRAIRAAWHLGIRTRVHTDALHRPFSLPGQLDLHMHGKLDKKNEALITKNIRWYRKRKTKVDIHLHISLRESPALQKYYLAFIKKYADSVSISLVRQASKRQAVGAFLCDVIKKIRKLKKEVHLESAIPPCLFSVSERTYLYGEAGLFSNLLYHNSRLPCVHADGSLSCGGSMHTSKITAHTNLTRLHEKHVLKYNKQPASPRYQACKSCTYFPLDCQGGLQ